MEEFKVRVHVKIDGEYQLWESLSEEEQKRIGRKLNDIALRSIGYVQVAETRIVTN